MQFRFFWVPVVSADTAAESLNVFLASHSVVNADVQFVQSGSMVGWAISVQTVTTNRSGNPGGAGTSGTGADAAGVGRQRAERIDYRAVLSAEDFVVFAQLRKWRKVRAAEDGVPIYAIAHNEHLAMVARDPEPTLESIRKIPGLGKTRVREYADSILNIAVCARSEVEVQP